MFRPRFMVLGALGFLFCACGPGREGTTTPATPTSKIVQIDTGAHHSCAVTVEGSLYCWGRDLRDQSRQLAPYRVEVGMPVASVSVGTNHACAISTSGALRCWGRGEHGRLGYASNEDVRTPNADVELGGKAIKVSAGHAATCAVLEGGKIRCWGTATDGRLGYGDAVNVGESSTPASAGAVSLGGDATAISLGSIGHACVRLDSGDARCWGADVEGQLGQATQLRNDIGDDDLPSEFPVIAFDGKIKEISAGSGFTCVLMETGSVRCWGLGSVGQLGRPPVQTSGPKTSAQITPDQIARAQTTPATAPDIDLGGPAKQIRAGGAHVCALMETGGVRCWGANTHGQLGYGAAVPSSGPATAPLREDVNLGGRAIAIDAGGRRSCALLDNGEIRCWGQNIDDGGSHLGYPTTASIGLDRTPAEAGSPW